MCNCCLVSDSQLSFIKLSKSQSSKPAKFHTSKNALELEEKYNIKFQTHPPHYAMFSDRAERPVSIVKRSFKSMVALKNSRNHL